MLTTAFMQCSGLVFYSRPPAESLTFLNSFERLWTLFFWPNRVWNPSGTRYGQVLSRTSREFQNLRITQFAESFPHE